MRDKVLVTGGAGFIGSEFVRQAVGKNIKVIVVDKLTYAGDMDRLSMVENKIRFYQADICDRKRLEKVFKKEKPSAVVHFAAESHVDRSIANITPFLETNVTGTSVLIDLARQFRVKKFIHISTDEVYGVKLKGQFAEHEKLNPLNPYSATKAAADHLIMSAVNTFGFPGLIVRPSNCYGPWQHPEKFIPVVIGQALEEKPVPIYGKGKNVREWLHVCDCVRGMLLLLEKGKIGEIYNLGSNIDEQNIRVAKKILKFMSKPQSLLKFVNDRPGHDFRYRLNSSKIRSLGFKPVLTFNEGLLATIIWYKSNWGWLVQKRNS